MLLRLEEKMGRKKPKRGKERHLFQNPRPPGLTPFLGLENLLHMHCLTAFCTEFSNYFINLLQKDLAF